MRYAVPEQMLERILEQDVRELTREREQVRLQLDGVSPKPPQWAELEIRARIAELAARKATPSARRTIESALAAVRAFRDAL